MVVARGSLEVGKCNQWTPIVDSGQRLNNRHLHGVYSEWAGGREAKPQDTHYHLNGPSPNPPNGLSSAICVAVSSCMGPLQLAGLGLALGEGGWASVASLPLRTPCASLCGQPGPPPTCFHLQRTLGGTRFHSGGRGGAAEQVCQTPILGLHCSGAPRRVLPLPSLCMQRIHIAPE